MHILPQYLWSEEQLVKKFNEDPVDIWINSIGGCKSNFIAERLSENYKVYNDAYNYKGCHYYRPLDKVLNEKGENVKKLFLFCDIGISISSQIKRKKYHNFLKLQDPKNLVSFNVENWIDLIHKQMTNWLIRSDISFVNTQWIDMDTNTPFLPLALKPLNISEDLIKPRKTYKYHPLVKPYKQKINNIMKEFECFDYKIMF